ncbi:MAG: hypothetical protein LAP85_21570 [Acidobacteriia bacterium]|nr:hypothetical protein [Terriglobia bacterium]
MSLPLDGHGDRTGSAVIAGPGLGAADRAHSRDSGARGVISARGLARALAAGLVVALTAGTVLSGRSAFSHPSAQGSQVNLNAGYWLDKLEKWRTAVAQHDPGKLDDAATTISSWTRSDLMGLLAEIRELVKLLHESPARAVGSLEQQWLGLTGDEARHGDVSRILKRGALLHTDIAILAPGTASPTRMGAVVLVQINDGRAVGRGDMTHWEFARLLLDSVYPHPSDDDMVRQWYLATTAWMHSSRQWGTSTAHLERAQAIFPSDAGILFFNGVLHESYAGAGAQNFLRAAAPGVRFSSVRQV